MVRWVFYFPSPVSASLQAFPSLFRVVANFATHRLFASHSVSVSTCDQRLSYLSFRKFPWGFPTNFPHTSNPNLKYSFQALNRKYTRVKISDFKELKKLININILEVYIN